MTVHNTAAQQESDNLKAEALATENALAPSESPNGKPRDIEAAVPTTKGQKFKALVRRWWWLLLIIFIAGALIVVLPFVYVGIPNIAQRDVNKSTLDITSQVVSDPKPSSVHITLQNVAKSGSSFHPTLDSFQAALFLENTEPDIKPFGYVTIPKSKADKETVITVDQVLEVADAEQFAAYTVMVMKSETFRVGVRGRTGLKLPGLKAFNVDYNKAVTMKGLNGLAGFEVRNFSILLTPEADGTNMIGQVYIPNPSVLTIAMGNVTMDLSVAGTPIGQSLIPNLTLAPGDNLLPMRSVTNQTAVLNMIIKTYKDGYLPVDIVGNSSVNDAGEHLTYFEAAIKSNTLSARLNVGEALAAIGLNITAL